MQNNLIVYFDTIHQEYIRTKFWTRFTPSYIQEQQNHVFNANLKFIKFGDKNYCILEDVQNGIKFHMFISDLEKAFYIFDKGLITGSFCFVQKGSYYGIKYHE